MYDRWTVPRTLARTQLSNQIAAQALVDGRHRATSGDKGHRLTQQVDRRQTLFYYVKDTNHTWYRIRVATRAVAIDSNGPGLTAMI